MIFSKYFFWTLLATIPYIYSCTNNQEKKEETTYEFLERMNEELRLADSLYFINKDTAVVDINQEFKDLDIFIDSAEKINEQNFKQINKLEKNLCGTKKTLDSLKKINSLEN